MAANLPEDCVVIGHDAGAAPLVLDRYGQVGFIDNDTGKFFLVARDFAQFLSSIVRVNA